MFPTPVGMNRLTGTVGYQTIHVPHTRGDEPDSERTQSVGMQCSPHPWG